MSRLEDLQRKAQRLEELKAKAAQGAPQPSQQPVEPEVRREPVTGLPDPSQFKGFGAGMEHAEESKLIGAGRGLTDIGESLEQLRLEAVGEPEEIEAFTRKAAEGRRAFAETPVGQSIPGQAGRFAGQVIPSVALPGAATTFAGRTALGAATGAGLGFGGFRPEETPEARMTERVEQAKKGAVLGAAIPAALTVGKALTPAALGGQGPLRTATALGAKSRILSKEFKDTGKLLKEFGMKGTIGGQSASEFMMGVEAKLRGGTHESIKQGINTANKAILNAFKSFKSKTDTRQFHQVGKRVFDASDKAVDKLNSTRIAEFGSEMNRIESLGGNKFIRVDNLENLLSGKSGGSLGSKALRDRVANELDDLQAMHGGSGLISAKQLQDDLMSPLSAATVGKGKLWPDLGKDAKKELARDLMKALNLDLDDAIRTGEGGAAAQILKRARDRYSANSKPIDEIKNSVLGSILNEPGVTAKGIGQVSMESVGKKLNKMSPEQISRTMHLLRKYDGKSADDLINLRIDNAIGKATQRKAGEAFDLSDLDVNKLISELGGEPSLRALLKGKYHKFERAIKASQIIAPVRVGAGREAIGSAAQIGGTLISANPTFAAINAARVLGPIGLRKALLDPKGQQAVIDIARGIGKPQRFQKELAAAAESLRQFGEEDGQ